MKLLILSILLLATSARGLYACCAYEKEGGGCDIIQCPGECIIVGDECPNRANEGCFLQSTYNLGDNGCETCECDPFGDRTRTGVVAGANKYGSLKIGPQILQSKPPKGKKGKTDL